MPGMSTRHAPDARLPLWHIATGIVAALLGGIALLVRGPALLAHPLGDPPTLAVTHLFTLGWLAMTIVGATYQLVPVVLEAPLASQRLAHAGYPLLVAGVAAMVAGFWLVRPGLLVGGAAAAGLALTAYAVQIAATAARARGGRTTRGFFIVASAYLLGVAVLGILLASDWRWGFALPDLIPTHLLFALAGWLTLLAMGVAYHLTPMFALSHDAHADGGAWVLSGFAGGTLLLVVAGALGWPATWVAAAALVPLGAVGLFVRDQWRLLRARRRALDVGMRLAAAGFAYLALTAAAVWLDLAGVVHIGHGALVVLALLGWLGCLVGGQTYKIVPFLVWYRHYGARAGRGRVPLLREMYHERLANAGSIGLMAAGLLLAAGAAWQSPGLERAGALAWLIGYGTLAWNMIQVQRA